MLVVSTTKIHTVDFIKSVYSNISRLHDNIVDLYVSDEAIIANSRLTALFTSEDSQVPATRWDDLVCIRKSPTEPYLSIRFGIPHLVNKEEKLFISTINMIPVTGFANKYILNYLLSEFDGSREEWISGDSNKVEYNTIVIRNNHTTTLMGAYTEIETVIESLDKIYNYHFSTGA